jgi:hypothetical protein
MCGTIDPEHAYDEYLVLLAKSGMTITWVLRPYISNSHSL